MSARAGGPFAVVNVPAVSETLFESELFGHEAGAYTGAIRRKPGLVEVAEGGTLFLDEVGDMSTAVQAKVLRFLQERSFRRVGGIKRMSVDLRIVAASNHDLRAMVDAGTFRKDLFFRIAVFPIRIPPLRQHPEDIELLCRHILRQMDYGGQVTAEALDCLRGYSWPGNVRELQSVLAQARLTAAGGDILVKHIGTPEPPSAGLEKERGLWNDGPPGETLKAVKQWAERTAIQNALDRSGSNVNTAARILGVTPQCVYQKMKSLGIPVRKIVPGKGDRSQTVD
jgi:transcriptional regulator with PAS, ATPase and Fis domain